MIGLVVPVPDATRHDLTVAFTTALRAVGMKHETCAYLMGITPAQLSRDLASGHVSIHRLLMVATDQDGRAFLSALWPRLGSLIGIECIDEVAALLAEAVSLLKPRASRTAKAHLIHAEQEKRTA